ncbi:MAG: threonine synthase [Proteobacteria bacterium]|nr:threonine synthase [Pseudomonadota bacterium]
MSFVSHLECSLTGERVAAGGPQTVSPAGAPLLVRYDLPRLARALSKAELAKRPPGMWRYLEFLPLRGREDILSLGECETPLVALPRLGARLGGGEILVKDEGRMPTGSFKARGLSIAVAMARAFGVRRIAMPTAGNAGAALAAYGARAGIECFVFCPEDAPEAALREAALHGARVFRVDGLINHCGELVARGAARMGWFDFSTLREPYRIEGKKTMGLELAERLGWRLPDAIFYPTGGGTGLIGMWKAFRELAAIGWVEGRMPRMVAVQSTGCAPLVRAFDQGAAEVREPWAPVETRVHGVRVPKPFGDRLCLKVLAESGGFGEAVADEAVEAMRAEIARSEGLNLSLEGAACAAAYAQALAKGRVGPAERVVLFNCASGLKSEMPAVTRRLDRHAPIDFAALGTG